jgi:hypothetical protein
METVKDGRKEKDKEEENNNERHLWSMELNRS